jgi:hypothetical protein
LNTAWFCEVERARSSTFARSSISELHDLALAEQLDLLGLVHPGGDALPNNALGLAAVGRIRLDEKIDHAPCASGRSGSRCPITAA